MNFMFEGVAFELGADNWNLREHHNVKGSPLNRKSGLETVVDRMHAIWNNCKAYLKPLFLIAGGFAIGAAFLATVSVAISCIPIAALLAAMAIGILGLMGCSVGLISGFNFLIAANQFNNEFSKSLNIANEVRTFLEKAKNIKNDSDKIDFNKELREYAEKINNEVKDLTSYPCLRFLANELMEMNHENISQKAMLIFSFQVQFSVLLFREDPKKIPKTNRMIVIIALKKKIENLKIQGKEINDTLINDNFILPFLDCDKKINEIRCPDDLSQTIIEMNAANFNDKVLDILSDYIKESYIV